MKLSLYFDVYPGAKPENIFFQNPLHGLMDKMDGTTRYLAEFEIPDPPPLRPPGVDQEIVIHQAEEQE